MGLKLGYSYEPTTKAIKVNYIQAPVIVKMCVTFFTTIRQNIVDVT